MEVYERCQAWKDVGDDVEFSHTIIILRKGREFFYALTNYRYRMSELIDPDDLEVHPIPAADIWPLFSDDLTAAPDPLPANSHVKLQSLLHYVEPDSVVPLADLLLNEARVCEILRNNPHPNIAQYLGCTLQDNRITGLCMVKYETTLADRLKDPDRSFDRNGCIKGIKQGIEHLHSLRLIHNDLNPHNIMFKADDTPVIIDFDSCAREGDKLTKGGTWGWTDENIKFASPMNDYYGLKKIEEAMDCLEKNI